MGRPGLHVRQCDEYTRQPAEGHATPPRFQRTRTTALLPEVPQVSTTHTGFSLGYKHAALLREARGRSRPRRQTLSAVRESSWRTSVVQDPTVLHADGV